MARRLRIRKLREELEELEGLEHPADRSAVVEKGEEKEQEPEAAKALQHENPVTRTLELQKAAGNKAVGATLARWPTFAAPQPVAQWPKQLEMVLDGKVVIPLESAQMGNDRRLSNATARGTDREKPADESGEMVVTLKQGEWSSSLFRESLYGRGYKKVEIVFPGKDGKGLRVILTDVLISSYSIGGDHGEGVLESITLSFKKRELSQDPPPPRR